MAGWSNPLDLLHEELLQARDEGAGIPADLAARIATVPETEAWRMDLISCLYDAVASLPVDAGLAAREPDDLAAIRVQRPAGPRELGWRPDDAELLDRLHGAWTGRAFGCALGKPFEAMGMSARDGRLAGRARIKAYLTRRGDWPLVDYASGADAGDAETLIFPASQREGITCMEPDDDIHYSLVGLGVVETHGPAFTWDQVARFWCQHIPIYQTCTAERQALVNFLARSTSGGGCADPAYTRRHRNPYREWIGAQIRSDGYAFCCAGRPELAAEFAWRDAHWTHVRNGIYGAMFMAAMQAAAFAVDDPLSLVRIGLSEIPAECRLARAISALLAALPGLSDWEAGMAWIEAYCAGLSPSHRFEKKPALGMSPVHTINNAMVCVLALVTARLDPLRTPATAVMAGLDTDCNGATVGSIVGAVAGRRRLAGHPCDRLNDLIRPAMVGFEEVRMRVLAERSARQWRRVLAGGQAGAMVGEA